MQKIFVTTGGTGGHIIPARCLAENLALKYKVFFLGDKKYKNYIKKDDNFKSFIVNSSKIERSFFKLILATIKIFHGALKSLLLIIFYRPKYIFSFGGYASFPVLLGAVITRRKIILHEQNSHLGKVNSLFLKYAKKLALTFTETDNIDQIYKDKIIISGNPTRKEIISLNKNEYSLPQKVKKKESKNMGYDLILASEIKSSENNKKYEKFNILVIGGSGGAKIFSEVLPKSFFNLSEIIKNEIEIVQQCRKDLLEKTFKQYEKFNLTVEINSFFENMAQKIEKAHLIIARSGSSSINEFLVAKKPMILIPYPYAADNHQLKNAKILEKEGCAIIIEEKDFNIYNLSKILQDSLQNHKKLIEMSNNCKKLAILDATTKLANLIDE